jgi:Spy/CpxP family protein refolding chaperone
MKGMMKRLFALSLAVAVFAGGSTVINCRAADDAVPRRAAAREQLKEKFGLTDEQLDKIKTEFGAHKETIKDITSRLHAARTNLRDTIQKSGVSEADVRAAAAKLAAVEADAAVLRSKLFGKVNSILTDQQRAKLKEVNTHMDDFLQKLLEKAGDRLNLQ